MSQLRQDAWTKEEDIVLADTILQYIKQGGTQLDAFKDVAIKLNRTSAACGFRWNATIRKQYEKEIHEAKSARKKEQIFQPIQVEDKPDIDTAIQLLQQMKVNYQQDGLQYDYETKQVLNALQQENTELKLKIERFKETYQDIKKRLEQFNE